MAGPRASRSLPWIVEADGSAYRRSEVSVGRIAWADVSRVFKRDTLTGLRCNSDVQLPYRLPIIERTYAFLWGSEMIRLQRERSH